MGDSPSVQRGQVTLAAVVRVHDEAALQRVGGHWMAATSDDRLHTFDGPGGVSEVAERIVELVDGSRSVTAIIEVLLEEFEVSREEAEHDTLEFISLLVEKRVLTL